MGNRTYELVGRRGDDGGRYLVTQWPQMKKRAWQMFRAGDSVQVWRAVQNGDLLSYDGEATRRVTDYIVEARKALSKFGVEASGNP